MSNFKKSTWIKNFGKSVKYTGIEIVSEMIPNTKEIISSAKMAKESAKELKNTITGSRSTMRILDTEINRTEISRKAKEISKNALKDIKNGTFSMEKIKSDNNLDYDDYGEDNYSLDFINDNDDSDLSSSAKIITNFSNNGALIDATMVSTEVISKTSLKSADLTVKGINAVSLSGFIKLNESLMQTNNILSNIDSNVSQMITFYSDNVAVTNQAIMETMQLIKDDLESKKKKDDYNSNENPLDLFSGNLSLGGYKDYVKKNIKSYTDTASFFLNVMTGNGFGGLDSEGPSLFKNPVQFLFKEGMKWMIPADLKKSVENFDATIPKAIRRNLLNMSKSDNIFISMLSSIFGLDAPLLNKINMGNYYKNAVNWDGKSKKALEEVIPNLLNEIAKNTSKDNLYKGKTFDYDKGIFVDNEKVEENLKKKLQSSISLSYSNMIDRVENIFKTIDFGDISEDEEKTIKSNVGKVFSDIAISNTLSPYSDSVNLRSKKSVDKILNKHNLDKRSINTIYKILSQFSSSDILNYDDQNLSTKDDLKSLLKNISNEDEEMGIYRSLMINGEDSTNLISKLLKETNFFQYLEIEKKNKEEKMTEREKNQKKYADKIKKMQNELINKRSSPLKFVSNGINSITNRIIDTSYNNNIEESDDLRNINLNYENEINKKRSSNLKDIERGIINETNIENITAEVLQSTDSAMIGISQASNDIKSTFNQGISDLYSMFLKPTYSAIFGKNGILSKIWNNDQIKSLHSKITKFLFGEKGEDRIYKDGLFSSITNHFLDGIDYIKYAFTGKGYTNRAGKMIEDNKEISVLENIKKGFSSIYSNTMKYLFGNDYKNNNTYNKLFGKIASFFSNKKNKDNENYDSKESKKSSNVKNIERNIVEINPTEDDRMNAILGGKKISEVYADIKKKMKLREWKKFTDNKNRQKQSILSYKNRQREVESKNNTDSNLNSQSSSLDEDVDAASDDKKSNKNKLDQKIYYVSDRLKRTFFGNASEEDFNREFDRENKNIFLSKFSKTIATGLAGASLVGLSGGSMGLLGLFLPNSLIGGAIVGIGTSLLSNNEKFMETVFGSKSELDGKRTGAIVSKKLMEKFDKAKPAIIGGATLGAIKSVFGLGGIPGPLGILTNTLLPGGPLGGAILGMGSSLLFRNEKFQKLMFGEKDDNGKWHKGFFSKMLNKFSNSKENIKKNANYIKGGLKGALVGGISSAVISEMGILGSALTFGGPIGGAIAGLSIGIASQSDKFKNYLFGTQKFDKNGNPIGREKDGLISRFTNLFNVNVIQKLKDGAEEATIHFVNWFKRDMVKPFKQAFGPVLDKLSTIKDEITDVIKGTFAKIGEGIVSVFKSAISPIATFAKNVIIKPMGKVVTNLLKFTSKITGKLLSFPLKLLAGLLAPKRTAALLKAGGRFISNQALNVFNKTDEYGNKIGLRERLKSVGSLINLGREFGENGIKTNEYNEKIGRNKTQWEVFRDRYFESNGMGSLGWQKSEEYRYDKRQGKNELKEFEQRKKIHNQMAKYVNEDNGDESKILNNKTYQKRLRKLEKLGVDISRIKSQQDLKEAMFHYDDWVTKPEREVKEIQEQAEIEIKDRETRDEYRSSVQDNFKNTINLLEAIKDILQGKIKSRQNQQSEADILENIDTTLNATQKSTEKVEEATINTERGIANFIDPSSEKNVTTDEAIKNRKNDLKSGKKSDQDSANIENLKEAFDGALTDNRNAQNDYEVNKEEKAIKKAKKDKETEEVQSASFKNKISKRKEYDENDNKVLQALLKIKDNFKEKKGSNILSGIFGKLYDLGVDALFKFGIPTLTASLAYKIFKGNWGANLISDAGGWIKNTTSELMGWSDKDGSRTDYNDAIIENSGMQETTFKFLGKSISKNIQKAFGVLGIKGNFVDGAEGLWQMASSPFKTAYSIGKDGISVINNNLIKNSIIKNTDDIAKSAVKGTEAIGNQLPKSINKIMEFIKNIFTKASKSKAVAACGDDVVEAVAKEIPDMIESSMTNPSILAKFASKIMDCSIDVVKGAAKFLPVLGQIWTAGELIWNFGTGITMTETANLFGVSQNAVNIRMRIICAAVKCILGFFSVGSIFDLVSEIISAITGGQLDFKKWIATFLYGIMATKEEEAKLIEAQSQFDMDWENYNEKYGTNLSKDAYNDRVNQTIWNKLVHGKDKINEDYTRSYIPSYLKNREKYYNVLNKTKFGNTKKTLNNTINYNTYPDSNYNIPYTAVSANINANTIEQAGVYPIPTSEIATAQNINSNNSYRFTSYGDKNITGYGDVIGYGSDGIVHQSQYNARWRNMPIGRMPNGKISTMATGGCGPTALAMAASAVKNRNTNPAAIASMAVKKGYITQGGSSAALFDKGSKELGLKTNRITSGSIESSLKMGRPIVLSGKSNSKGSAYSPIGHIVTATGMDRRGNVILHDPRRRNATLTSLRNLKNGFKTGWAFGKKSIGYGDVIGYGDNTETIKVTADLDYKKREKIKKINILVDNSNEVFGLLLNVFNLTFNKIPEIMPNVFNSYGSKYNIISKSFMEFISKLLYLNEANKNLITNKISSLVQTSYNKIESYIKGIDKSLIMVNNSNPSNTDIANIFGIEKKYIDMNMKLSVKFISEVISLPFISDLLSTLINIFDEMMDWDTISNINIFIYNSIAGELKKSQLLKHQKEYEEKILNKENEKNNKVTFNINSKNKNSWFGNIKNKVISSWKSISKAIGFGDDAYESDPNNILNDTQDYDEAIQSYYNKTNKKIDKATQTRFTRYAVVKAYDADNNETVYRDPETGKWPEKRHLQMPGEIGYRWYAPKSERSFNDKWSLGDKEKRSTTSPDDVDYKLEQVFYYENPKGTAATYKWVLSNDSRIRTLQQGKEDYYYEVQTKKSSSYRNQEFNKREVCYIYPEYIGIYYPEYMSSTTSYNYKKRSNIYKKKVDEKIKKDEVITREEIESNAFINSLIETYKYYINKSIYNWEYTGRQKEYAEKRFTDILDQFRVSGMLSTDVLNKIQSKFKSSGFKLTSQEYNRSLSSIEGALIGSKISETSNIINEIYSRNYLKDGLYTFKSMPEVQANALNGAIIYNQADPAWANYKIGSDTIGQSGCVLSSFAMGLTSLDGIDYRPDKLYEMAQVNSNNKAFDNNSNINWDTFISATEDFSNVKFSKLADETNKNNANIASNIENLLMDRKPVALFGNGSPYLNGSNHAILATGFVDDDPNKEIMINDPNGGRSRTATLDSLMKSMKRAYGMTTKDDKGLEVSPELFSMISESGTAQNESIDQNQSENDNISILDKFIAIILGGAKAKINGIINNREEKSEKLYDDNGNYIGKSTLSNILNLFGLTEDDNSNTNINSSNNQSVYTTSDAQGRAKYIWDYITGKGVTPEGTAGLLGNLRQETSEINPMAGIDGNGAFGIVQWNGGRKNNMINYAQNQGKSKTDFNTQVDFMWKELSGSYKNSTLDKIQNSNNIQEAANSVLLNYEIPVKYNPNSDPNKVGSYNWELNTRTNYANQYFDAFTSNNTDSNFIGPKLSNNLNSFTINHGYGSDNSSADIKLYDNEDYCGMGDLNIADGFVSKDTKDALSYSTDLVTETKNVLFGNDDRGEYLKYLFETDNTSQGEVSSNHSLSNISSNTKMINYNKFAIPIADGTTGFVPDSNLGFASYKQGDKRWANKYYSPGSGSFKDAACSITSMADVVTGLKGKKKYPTDFIKDDLFNWGGWKKVAEREGLIQVTDKSSTIPGSGWNEADIKNALDSGEIIVASGKGSAPYTSGGHYVVLHNYTTDKSGNISGVVVADPNRADAVYDVNTITSQGRFFKTFKNDPSKPGTGTESFPSRVSGYGDFSFNDFDNELDKINSNIDNINISSIGTTGYGDYDSYESLPQTFNSNTNYNSFNNSLADKLEVAVSTDKLEKKVDILINVIKDCLSSLNTTVNKTTNNYTSISNNEKGGNPTIINSNTSIPSQVNYLKSKHDAITRGIRI